MSEITEFIQKKYKAEPVTSSYLESLWQEFAPVAEKSFIPDFTSGNPEQFQQRYWEMYLYNHLKNLGYEPERKNPGPDFKLKIEERIVWIEATAPGSSGVPERKESIDKFNKEGGYVPQKDFTLAITGALESKIKKIEEYIQKKIIDPANDIVVLAINPALLGMWGMRGHNFPRVFEIACGLGIKYVSVAINPETGEPTKIREEIKYQPYIENQNNATVDTDIFNSERWKIISVLLASDAIPQNPTKSMHAVYNWQATNELPKKMLGAGLEFYYNKAGEGVCRKTKEGVE